MVAGADEDATRFYTPREVATEAIVPVAVPEGAAGEPLETGVPADPSEAQFKRLGEETGASKKRKNTAPAAAERKADEAAVAKSPVVAATPPSRGKREPAAAAAKEPFKSKP